MKIYLASGSPRRKELLTRIGLEFEVKVSEADERSEIKDPPALVEELSQRKALAVTRELINEGESDFLVIGADTVVSLDGKILGKPGDAEDAADMLRSLSGKTHEVYTGVTLVRPGEHNINSLREAGKQENFETYRRIVSPELKINTFHEKTSVSFCTMSGEEIEEYVATGDPLDKAGAYGIQGFCARYISGIEGDYNNVVGLPVGRLYREMKRLGLPV